MLRHGEEINWLRCTGFQLPVQGPRKTDRCAPQGISLATWQDSPQSGPLMDLLPFVIAPICRSFPCRKTHGDSVRRHVGVAAKARETHSPFDEFFSGFYSKWQRRGTSVLGSQKEITEDENT